MSSIVFFGTMLLGIVIVVMTEVATGEFHKTCIAFIASAAIVGCSTILAIGYETEQENMNTRNQVMIAMNADYDFYVGDVEVETIDQTILDHIGDYNCVFDHKTKKVIITYAPKEKRNTLFPIWLF